MLTTTLVTTTYDVATMLGCDALTRNIYSKFLQRGAGRSSLESSELLPLGARQAVELLYYSTSSAFLEMVDSPKYQSLTKTIDIYLNVS